MKLFKITFRSYNNFTEIQVFEDVNNPGIAEFVQTLESFNDNSNDDANGNIHTVGPF